jgi:Ni/Fe-hydrogenase 1 B-type cytochrome subunit
MLAQQDAFESERQARLVKAIYVYEAPLRLWHWVNALAITVLAITGYLIASPLPSQPGEASDNFLMGYIRFAHFSAAYVFAIGFLGRIYWGFVGNHHARQIFILPVWDAKCGASVL